MKLSVQLYTLRDQTSKDFAATMREVAAIGLRYVELAGFGNVAAARDAKKILGNNGLSVSGAHIGLEKLGDDINAVLDEQQLLGNRFVIVPWLGESHRTIEGYRRVAAALNRAADQCATRGIELAYHNHSFEFQLFDGQSGMDILLNNTEPRVGFELDVYWLAHGGQDPAKFIARVGKRARLLHLKDMAAGAERRFAPVGSGVLDFESILRAGREAGAEFGAIEQDVCYDLAPIESVRQSLAYLKSLGLS